MLYTKGRKINNPLKDEKAIEFIIKEYSEISLNVDYIEEIFKIIDIILEYPESYNYYFSREMSNEKIEQMDLIYRAPRSRTTIMQLANKIWIINFPEQGALVTSNDDYFNQLRY